MKRVYVPVAFTDSPKAKGVVYAIQCGEFVKVGMTKNLKQRFKQFEDTNPHELRLLIYRSVPFWYRTEFEQVVHKALETYRFRREWYRVSPEIVIGIIKAAHRKATARIPSLERAFRAQLEAHAELP